MTLPPRLLALTLQQPWAAAVRDLDKCVENRAWRPPAHVLGQYIAIHAGKTFDERGAQWIAAHFGASYSPGNTATGALVALARLSEVTSSRSDPWFFGPYGWVFDNVIPLEPVLCRGARHLWRVPDAAYAQVTEQLLKRVSAPK
ncbi:hypothetical protein [Deinococcus planocerae]|uniref:hypothetical protein n=1 Tax=Deinococcus planocerae TaxID=1737569 RepID=UPI000C7F691F|nr:hypothetical protein [Deinococcus planocerae]